MYRRGFAYFRDSVDELAKDFRLDKTLIEAAVRFERPRLPTEVAA
jgi:hypothetical protein